MYSSNPDRVLHFPGGFKSPFGRLKPVVGEFSAGRLKPVVDLNQWWGSTHLLSLPSFNIL